jgi:hypothetical protein
MVAGMSTVPRHGDVHPLAAALIHLRLDRERRPAEAVGVDEGLQEIAVDPGGVKIFQRPQKPGSGELRQPHRIEDGEVGGVPSGDCVSVALPRPAAASRFSVGSKLEPDLRAQWTRER